MEDYTRGKLDGQILQELKDLNGHMVTMARNIEGQEARIRVLENWRWWLLGGSAAIGIGAAKITHAMLSI